MKAHLSRCVVLFLVGGLLWAGAPPAGREEAQPKDKCEHPCPAPSEWFPVTPKPNFSKPDPDLDCDFYKFSWQSLLYITQEAVDGAGPRFLSFETKDELFPDQPVSRFPKPNKNVRLSLAPRVALRREPLSSSDILQAGSQGIVVDKKGKAVYYAIHLNDVFSDFIRRHGYTDFAKLKFAPADQEFPRGSLEIKSSWRIVPDDEPAGVTDTYFTTQAAVSPLRNNAGVIEVDPGHPLTAKVALLGIHVVGRVDGHPEFIWATFEHNGNAPDGSTTDIPAMGGQPAQTNVANQDPAKPVDVMDKDYIMYKKGTLAKDCNVNRPKELVLDEKTQTITGQRSIFRVFPFGGDDEPCVIKTLNDSVHDQIRQQQATLPKDKYDKLRVWTNYDLKGAIWLNNPAYFRERVDFAQLADDTKNANKILGGDTRLSNTTIESYTQGTVDATTKVRGIQSCFHCHRTVAEPSDLTKNRSLAPIQFPAKRIGVSHILTSAYFLAHEEFNVRTQKLEDDWRKAVITNDPDKIGKFLGADFVFTDPNRRTRSREDHLNDFKDGTLKIDSVEFAKNKDPDADPKSLAPWTIDVYENVTIVSFTADVKGTYQKKDISGSYLFSDTLMKQEGRWVAVTRQQTPVK
jgi:hypothetical protein